jgi:hypothetical protein
VGTGRCHFGLAVDTTGCAWWRNGRCGRDRREGEAMPSGWEPLDLGGPPEGFATGDRCEGSQKNPRGHQALPMSQSKGHDSAAEFRGCSCHRCDHMHHHWFCSSRSIYRATRWLYCRTLGLRGWGLLRLSSHLGCGQVQGTWRSATSEGPKFRCLQCGSYARDLGGHGLWRWAASDLWITNEYQREERWNHKSSRDLASGSLSRQG